MTSTVDRVFVRAAGLRGLSGPRMDAAVAEARRLDARARSKGKGKPCGKGYIAPNLKCAKGSGGALTPRAVTSAPTKGTDWRRTAATEAGYTALGAAIALPVASFVASGDPRGRRRTAAWARQAQQVESIAARGMAFPAAWPIAGPIGMGAMAAKEGIKLGSGLRRRTESLRNAPGYAKAAAGLARRKATRAGDIRYTQQGLNRAYEAGTPPSASEALRREREAARNATKAAEATRQAETRARAARRAARIARTSSPWRSTPSPSERWLTETLLGRETNPLKRAGGSLTVSAIRQLQRTGSRRVRIYPGG